ncbi:hypothetical protein [Devosia sp. I507]|uniref:hypothetical protein n=1 Tax=Devosia sp. I507 TaxID=2083786 RepID=UPI0018E52DDC|nr:hypothetical protein [Devosia sp. I507]
MLAELGQLPSARQDEFLTCTDRISGEIGLEISWLIVVETGSRAPRSNERGGQP